LRRCGIAPEQNAKPIFIAALAARAKAMVMRAGKAANFLETAALSTERRVDARFRLRLNQFDLHHTAVCSGRRKDARSCAIVQPLDIRA
jgi:hypothetical protein